MKQKIFLTWLFSVAFTASAWAERQEGCAAAVDAADSMNVNQIGDCDYSDEGLNGYLHKAFNNSKKQETAATTPKSKPAEAAVQSAAPSLAKPEAAQRQFKQEVDQWAGVNLARTQMMPKILGICDRGFRLISEEYRPLPMGRIELKLLVECIEQ
jgi:hypothetical protein